MDDPDDEVQWLDDEERAAWLALIALSTLMPASLEAQLQRDAGIGFFDYTVLAMLSEQPDRTQRMSQLAHVVNGSLSRLSHVAKRLERRGYLERRPDPEDGRITVATITADGMAAIERLAPGHVAHVRRTVLDPLDRSELGALRTACLKMIAQISPDVGQALTDGP